MPWCESSMHATRRPGAASLHLPLGDAALCTPPCGRAARHSTHAPHGLHKQHTAAPWHTSAPAAACRAASGVSAARRQSRRPAGESRTAWQGGGQQAMPGAGGAAGTAAAIAHALRQPQAGPRPTMAIPASTPRSPRARTGCCMRRRLLSSAASCSATARAASRRSLSSPPRMVLQVAGAGRSQIMWRVQWRAGADPHPGMDFAPVPSWTLRLRHAPLPRPSASLPATAQNPPINCPPASRTSAAAAGLCRRTPAGGPAAPRAACTAALAGTSCGAGAGGGRARAQCRVRERCSMPFRGVCPTRPSRHRHVVLMARCAIREAWHGAQGHACCGHADRRPAAAQERTSAAAAQAAPAAPRAWRCRWPAAGPPGPVGSRAPCSCGSRGQGGRGLAA